MAKEAGVRVVPVSIGNLHRWMPKDAILPLAPIRQVEVVMMQSNHPPSPSSHCQLTPSLSFFSRRCTFRSTLPSRPRTKKSARYYRTTTTTITATTPLGLGYHFFVSPSPSLPFSPLPFPPRVCLFVCWFVCVCWLGYVPLDQVRAACFAAVNSGLPVYQQAPAALPGGAKAADE